MVDPKYEAQDYETNLVQIQEECAEVVAELVGTIGQCAATQVAVSKLQRFGAQGSNPTLPPELRVTNAAALLRELADLERRIGVVRSFVLEQMPTPASNAGEIRYYRASEKPYGVFSSLYRCDILFGEDATWFTSAEHAYQYGKPRKDAVREWLMAAPSPGLLAMAAHGLYYWDIAPGWSRIKLSRMLDVQRAKFKQHHELARVLLETGDAVLVESGTVDNEVNRFWGVVDGVGQNNHGKILMQVRAELREEADITRYMWLLAQLLDRRDAGPLSDEEESQRADEMDSVWQVIPDARRAAVQHDIEQLKQARKANR